MANKIEYIFSLQDKISAKLGGITATSDKTAATLSAIRDKVSTVDAVFNDTGRTIGSLKMKIDALQAEKEWIPADNLPAIKEYNKQINRLSKEINNLEVASSGGKFKGWAKDAFRSLPGADFITNPLVAGTAALGFAGKTAMDFDKNIAAINVTAQLDEKGLAEMSDKIREITKKNHADIRIAPVGFEKIISQTGDLDMSYEILNSTQRAARTGLVDMDTAAAALAQTMSVIGKENANANDVLDVFFAAKRVGAGEFQDFARYMPGLIAGAKNMGIAYKEVAGTFAYMTGKGQTAERAAVLMENAFSILGRGEVRDKLALSGVDVFDEAGKVRGLVDIFGDLQGVMSTMNDEQKSSFLEGIGVVDKEAKNAFSILTSDVDKFNESMSDVSNATGETDKALEFSNNTTRKATETWNKLIGVGEQVGAIILPIISAGLTVVDIALSGVSSILDLTIGLFGGWYEYLSEGNPIVWGLTTALGAYTIAMGANYAISQKAVIISGIKKIADVASSAATWGLTTAQTALNAAFHASPLGLIVLGIGAVVGVVTHCWQKFEGFRVAIYGVWGVIKEFGSSLIDNIVNPFKQVLRGIGSVGSAIVSLVKGDFKEAAAAAKAGFKDIGEGVVNSNPIGIVYNAVAGGNYKQVWEQGKQDGRDSWAKSQAEKEEENNPITKVPETPVVSKPIVPVNPLAQKTDTSKVLNLNDDNTQNLTESATYSAITKKIAPLSVSLMPTIAATVDKVGNAEPNRIDDRSQNYEQGKENYLLDIMQNVQRIAAAVVLPVAISLATPSDAYALPSERNGEKSSYVSETSTTYETGKTVRVEKVCDQIVIHIQNTDNKGAETIKEEIMKILNELGDE